MNRLRDVVSQSYDRSLNVPTCRYVPVQRWRT